MGTSTVTGLRTTLEGGLRYRGREGQWSYVFNRVSGLATLLFLTLHILDTATVYFAPSLYEHAIALYRSTPFMLGEIALVGAVLFHGLNGYKVIYFDLEPRRWTERNEVRAFWWGRFRRARMAGRGHRRGPGSLVARHAAQCLTLLAFRRPGANLRDRDVALHAWFRHPARALGLGARLD
jgi:succinate dehydrogenase / fumarate reductase cytochrome b subunit